MVVTMLIGMWTSRIVLNALGFTDQGLYNVVGGVVGFSSLITASISGSITRFITYEIGRGNITKINIAVQNAVSVQWFLAAIVLIIGETLGLWFINTQLVIPEGRLFAVNCVYQFSIANIVIVLLSSAPNALIVAYERMNVFAFVSMATAVGSFCISLIIAHCSFDRLIFYSFLLSFQSLIVRIFYYIYIKKTFPELRLKFGFDRQIFKPIFAFAGWNAIGTSSSILRTSGTSVLLNIFGGPMANTINGIANQINALATILVNDFTTAYSPQITKRYAAGEYHSLITFTHQCAKISYSLIASIAIPVLFNMEPLLILWLKKIPPGTCIFGQLIIIYSLIDGLCRPLICAKSATGDIRNYQIIVGGILVLTLPLTYIFLKMGLPLYFSYVSMVITAVGAFIARMVMLKNSIPYWSSFAFIKKIVLRCLLATLVCLIVPAILQQTMPTNTYSILAQFGIGVMWCAGSLFLIAMNQHEQKFVIELLRKLKSKIFRQ